MEQTNQFQKNFAFAVAGLFITVVAILLHIEQMYLMAAAIILTPAVAWALGRVLTRGITCERIFPATCPEGSRVAVVLRIKNTARLPRFYIRAYDTIPAWLVRHETKVPLILQLEPGETREMRYEVEAIKRGAFLVGPLRLQTTDPFGLTRFGYVVEGTNEMLVLPSPLHLRRPFLQGGAFGWRGDQEGSRRGIGSDFYGVRDYQSGDELRRVHWRTTARTGRLVVAEQTQGEATHAIIALDVAAASYRGTGEGKESAIEYAVKIAATLIDDMVKAGHTVQLLTPDIVESAVPVRGDTGTISLMERLARVEPTALQSVAQTLSDAVGTIPQGGTLICITPASDPALRSALSEYAAMGLPVSTFLLDRESFSSHSPQVPISLRERASELLHFAGSAAARSDKQTNRGEAPTQLPGNVLPVSQGDDLVSIIESIAHARR